MSTLSALITEGRFAIPGKWCFGGFPRSAEGERNAYPRTARRAAGAPPRPAGGRSAIPSVRGGRSLRFSPSRPGFFGTRCLHMKLIGCDEENFIYTDRFVVSIRPGPRHPLFFSVAVPRRPVFAPAPVFRGKAAAARGCGGGAGGDGRRGHGAAPWSRDTVEPRH
jgi:hypothetical protein